VRLGILGGTFDPVHIAHLRVAEEVREALGLERVLFVPAGDPPLKTHTGAPAAARLEMVRLAVASHPAFEALDLEVRRDGPSYAADTLADLQRDNPGVELWFILGTDQLRALDQWREPRRVLERARLAVVRRPGEKEGTVRDLVPVSLADALESTVFESVPITALAISSTDIRMRLARGASVRYLVPDPVLEYIRDRRLYEEEH